MIDLSLECGFKNKIKNPVKVMLRCITTGLSRRRVATRHLKLSLLLFFLVTLGFHGASAQRTITVTSNADSGSGTLRAAIEQALSDDGVQEDEKTEDTIVFDFGGVPTTITLNSQIEGATSVFIAGPIIISGEGEDVTIDGGTTFETAREQRLFQIGGGDVTMENLTLQNFNHNASRRSNDDGGVFQVNPNSSLTLRNVTIQDSSSARRGGVGIVNDSTLIIENCNFLNNQSQQFGGVWIITGSTAEIRDSVFEGNFQTSGSVLDGGGAFQIEGGTLTMSGSTFSQNAAATRGNAVNLQNNVVATITDCTFDSNVGNALGAISLITGASLTATDCTISNNRSVSFGQGGGIYSESILQLTRCTVSNNGFLGGDSQFSRHGGGIYTTGEATIIDSTISGNSASNSTVGGGGIYARGVLTMKNTTLSGNSDNAGAALTLDTGADATLDSCTIAFNTGRGIQMRNRLNGSQPQLTLRNTLLSDNSRANLVKLTDQNVTNGVVTSDGFNLFDDATLSTNAVLGTGDQESADADLQALADNGGTTLTHDLGTNSDAIDTGSTDEAFDQRGFERPFGSADDIGAIENQPIFSQPTFDVGADLAVSENFPPQIIPGFLTNIASNDSGQDLAEFTVTTDSATDFFATINLSGDLTFASLANVNGTFVVTVTLEDEGTNNNVSDPQTFTITVAPVNVAPSFTTLGDQTVLEDAGTVDVDDFIAIFNPNDPEQSLVGYTVTNDNNALFSTQPNINTDGRLRFRPANNAFGSAEVSVFATDDGADNNTSPIQTFTITVESQFERPSFSLASSNRTVNEDAGARSFTGIATNISSNDTGQALVEFEVVADDTTLFSVQPAIDLNGTLTFTTATNAFGTTTLSITLVDEGADNNRSSTSTDFEIIITSQNDRPIVSLDSTILNARSSDIVSIASFAAFDPVEPDQEIIAIDTSNTNSTLFSVAPSVDLSGTLTFTVAAGAEGSATITIEAQEDSGGATDTGSASFNLVVEKDTIADFRALNGLPTDGSEDFDDASGNGIANILYYAFGFSDILQSTLPSVDPNNPAAGLPALEVNTDASTYTFSFVRLIDSDDDGINYLIGSSTDLVTFDDVFTLTGDAEVKDVETSAIDGDYELVTLEFDLVNDRNFNRVEITVDE